MLNYSLLHPPLLAALGRAGHGGRVVLADGNFPLTTAANSAAEVVHLNLRPGMVAVTDVLEPLLEAVDVELATMMASPDGSPVGAHADYARLLGEQVPVEVLGRWDFYEATRRGDVAVVVATADQRLCANVVLTVGVRER